MFLVTQYNGDSGGGGWAGFTYGAAATNQAFGPARTAGATLGVQGWGSANDFDSGDASDGAWLIQSVVKSGDTTDHYKNGGDLFSFSHTHNTASALLRIGAELNDAKKIDMDVAEAIIYDRALSSVERQQVETYLATKYAISGPTPPPPGDPIANDDGVLISDGDTIVIDVLANDSDDGSLDPATVTIIDAPDHGSITNQNATTGEVTYDHSGNGSNDSFTYTVDDDLGNTSNVATVSVTIQGSELPIVGFSDEGVLTGIDGPTGIEWLPDGRMLILEKDGTVWIADPSTGNKSQYMQLSNINSGQERGLLEIAIDPAFESTGHIYLFWTPSSPNQAVITRYDHQENSGGLTSTGDLASEFLIWRSNDTYQNCCHYGGGLDFGPDGKLWLSSSDMFTASTPNEGPSGGDNLPSDLSSSAGKVIRVNAQGRTLEWPNAQGVPSGGDGSPANPFVGEAGDDYIWAYGLRNPFRASWDLVNGVFYMGEVGGNQNSLSSEDVHTATLSQPGVNYGWPNCEGTGGTSVNPSTPCDPTHTPPIFSYPRSGGASITGGEVYRGSQFPAAWQGVYFYGDYTKDFIRYLTLDSTGTVVTGDFDFKPSAGLAGSVSTPTIVTVGTDGALYYARYGNGDIRRIVHSSGNGAPVVDSIAVTPLSGDAPLLVDFDATVSDPEGDPMTYEWTFGDGNTTGGTVPAGGVIDTTHTYTVDGSYTAFLEVSDAGKTTLSQVFFIQVGEGNTLPVINVASADVVLGDPPLLVTFTGDASDGDGDDLTYTWHFGDTTTQSGTVGAGGEANGSKTYTVNGTFNAYLEVDDGTATVTSDLIPIQIGTASEIPVTSGLVVSLEADIKVGLDGSDVLDWLDGSGQGNNLTASGDPQYELASTPSGLPSIVLDGTGDKLERLSPGESISGLPSGPDDRSMFIVAEYIDSNVFAGFGYGNGAPNEAFGLVVNGNNDLLTVQGWGAGNDFPSAETGHGCWLAVAVRHPVG